MRNRSQYEGYNNPLISWTFSDEWLQGESVFTILKTGGHTYRGTEVDMHFYQTSGEIPWR